MKSNMPTAAMKLPSVRVAGSAMTPLSDVMALEGIPTKYRSMPFYCERFLKKHGLKVSARLPHRKRFFRNFVLRDEAIRVAATLVAPVPAEPAAAPQKAPVTTQAPRDIAYLAERIDHLAEILHTTRTEVTALNTKIDALSIDSAAIIRASNVQADRLIEVSDGLKKLITEWQGEPKLRVA